MNKLVSILLLSVLPLLASARTIGDFLSVKPAMCSLCLSSPTVWIWWTTTKAARR